MATKQAATLNGVAPSWSDIGITFGIYGGATFVDGDIKAINWSDSLERGLVRGTSGGRKTKRTTGQYDCEASVTFYQEGWVKFQDALSKANAKIGLAGFDIIIHHTPPGTSKVFKVAIKGCLIKGRTGNNAEGTDPAEREIPLDVMLIEDEGKRLL